MAWHAQWSGKIAVANSATQKMTGLTQLLAPIIHPPLVRSGGMIFTFYKARGLNVGSSLVEDSQLELAKKLEAMAKEKGVQLLLPTDVVVADKFDANANSQVVSIDAIPDGWMGLDIGPDSVKTFVAALNECKTVVWNGPMVSAALLHALGWSTTQVPRTKVEWDQAAARSA